MKYNMNLNAIGFDYIDKNFKDAKKYIFQVKSNTSLVLSILEDLELDVGNEYEIEINIRKPGEDMTPKGITVQLNISDEIQNQINQIGNVFKAVKEKYPETGDYINEQIDKHMKI
jgi:hypothetical protein